MLEQRWLAVPFVVIVLATLLSANRYTYAQAWKPDRQVEILIGTSAGGPRDHMGRVLQKILQDQRLLDVPSTVVNKPGGGGAVSLAYLNQHPGDGRYVMINAISILTDHITGKSKLAYTDFTPLAILGRYIRFWAALPWRSKVPIMYIWAWQAPALAPALWISSRIAAAA